MLFIIIKSFRYFINIFKVNYYSVYKTFSNISAMITSF